MPAATIRKYVMTRGKMETLEEFASKNEWVLSDTLAHEQKQDYPVNCISVYYTVDLEAKQLTDKYFIATYHPTYKNTFKEISVAWLEEYFSVEANDLYQLDHPEENIIAPGGEIFTLLNAKDQIGVVAMLDYGSTVELGKMGIKKQYNGKGLAHPLMFEGVQWAKNHHKQFPHIDIYTAKHLTPAVNLYRKYGFEDVPVGGYTKFARVDLAMRLTF
ncbi:GNAT family acetyltransferase [Mucor ambiguus]|uniref:GNAT family acetyltransferase n=1 Tax=Mucor ambiguus TaxID=91626 RepID=A0A0C9LT83_9FUNG|nr:GNAT family acetyltransferase [Mucor ambiguus]